MKYQKVVLALVVGLVASWVACTAVVPSLIPGGGGIEAEVGEVVGAAPDELADGANLPPLPAAAEREAGLQALLQALERSARGDVEGAADEFDRAAALLPPFEGWAHVLAARGYAAAGRPEEVRRRVERAGTGAAREWAWRIQQEALLQVGDTAGAVSVGELAAESAALASERALAWASVGDLRREKLDPTGALEAYRHAMRAGRQSTGALTAARGAYDLPGLAPDDRLLIGRTLLAHGGLDRGLPMVEGYLAVAGAGSRDDAEVRLQAGRTMFNARRYEPAERLLRGASDQIPEAAFLLARTRYRAGNRAAGVDGFAAVSRSHPGSPASADALFLLGDLAHDEGRVSSAREYYRQAIGTAVHNASASDAAVRLAGIAIGGREPATAVSDLDAYLASRPRDGLSAPAVFWLGRARLMLGQEVEARARFQEVLEIDPFSYYGMLAADRLGTSLQSIRLAEAPATDPGRLAALDYVFFRIDLLRDLDLLEAGDFELARLQEQVGDDPGTLYALAEGMSQRGQPIGGALLGRRIQQQMGRWDDRLLRVVYQFPFRELVVEEARRNRLDPFAVAGLIRQESFFNPVAVSPAGAVGLMQLMPQTAAGMARGAGVANFQPEMLRDPAVNVRIGTLFLANQMSRWNGRLSDVYAAYNAGPNRVVRWRQLPEHGDDELYVERIPIAETRDYVKRVRLNGEIYRRLYSEGG